MAATSKRVKMKPSPPTNVSGSAAGSVLPSLLTHGARVGVTLTGSDVGLGQRPAQPGANSIESVKSPHSARGAEASDESGAGR